MPKLLHLLQLLLLLRRRSRRKLMPALGLILWVQCAALPGLVVVIVRWHLQVRSRLLASLTCHLQVSDDSPEVHSDTDAVSALPPTTLLELPEGLDHESHGCRRRGSEATLHRGRKSTAARRRSGGER